MLNYFAVVTMWQILLTLFTIFSSTNVRPCQPWKHLLPQQALYYFHALYYFLAVVNDSSFLKESVIQIGQIPSSGICSGRWCCYLHPSQILAYNRETVYLQREHWGLGSAFRGWYGVLQTQAITSISPCSLYYIVQTPGLYTTHCREYNFQIANCQVGLVCVMIILYLGIQIQEFEYTLEKVMLTSTFLKD